MNFGSSSQYHEVCKSKNLQNFFETFQILYDIFSSFELSEFWRYMKILFWRQSPWKEFFEFFFFKSYFGKFFLNSQENLQQLFWEFWGKNPKNPEDSELCLDKIFLIPLFIFFEVSLEKTCLFERFFQKKWAQNLAIFQKRKSLVFSNSFLFIKIITRCERIRKKTTSDEEIFLKRTWSICFQIQNYYFSSSKRLLLSI